MSPLFVSGGRSDPRPGARRPPSPRRSPLSGTAWERAGDLRVRIHVPPRIPGRRPVPLLLMLHGCDQDAVALARILRLDAAAAAAGLAVACAEREADPDGRRCWPWSRGPGGWSGRAATAALVSAARALPPELGLDPARVFVAGFGSGGAMALRVAAAAPGAFAGVAVHSGAPATAVAAAGDGASDAAADPGAAPGEGAGLLRERMGSGARALPLFALHGTADPEIEAGLGRRLGAAPARTETSLGRAPRGGLRYRRTIWWDAGGGPLGEAWIVEDLGHAWSGGRPGPSWSAPRGPDATREMIRFFVRARAP